MSNSTTAELDGVEATLFVNDEGTLVVQVDGEPSKSKPLRINVNEGRVFEAADLDDESTYTHGA